MVFEPNIFRQIQISHCWVAHLQTHPIIPSQNPHFPHSGGPHTHHRSHSSPREARASHAPCAGPQRADFFVARKVGLVTHSKHYMRWCFDNRSWIKSFNLSQNLKPIIQCHESKKNMGSIQQKGFTEKRGYHNDKNWRLLCVNNFDPSHDIAYQSSEWRAYCSSENLQIKDIIVIASKVKRALPWNMSCRCMFEIPEFGTQIRLYARYRQAACRVVHGSSAPQTTEW